VWQMPPDAGRIRGYVLTGHDGRVQAAVVTENGDWLFTGSERGSVLRWGIGTGVSGLEPLTLRGHSDWVTDLAVADDASRLASVSRDGTVKVWPVEAVLAGRPVVPVTLGEHVERATAALFAPERLGDPGCTVVTGDGVGNVRLWRFCADAHRPEATVLMRDTMERISALAASPDGRWLVAGDGGNRLWVWDLARPDDLQRPIELPSEQGTPNVIRFVDAGGTFLSASSSGTVEEWSLAVSPPTLVRTYRQPGDGGMVRALDYDAASQTLLVGSTAGQADVWRRSDRTVSSTSLPWEGGRIHAVALAGNGRTAVLAGESPFVRVWRDWSRPDRWQALPVGVEGVNDIALSPDGRMMAVAGADGVVYTWTRDATGDYGQRVAFQGHQEPVIGVKILAGTTAGDVHLISYDQEGEIRLWDLDQAALPDKACRAAGRNLTPDEEWPLYFPGEPWRPTCAGME
jgi:WD40 repeat protein